MNRTGFPIKLPLLAGLAALAVMVAGCHKQPAQPPVEEQPIEPSTPAAPPPPEPVETPKPLPPKAEAAPPPAPVAADQQVIDDAEATGMTAHVPLRNDDEAAQPGEDTNRQQ